MTTYTSCNLVQDDACSQECPGIDASGKMGGFFRSADQAGAPCSICVHSREIAFALRHLLARCSWISGFSYWLSVALLFFGAKES